MKKKVENKVKTKKTIKKVPEIIIKRKIDAKDGKIN